VIALNLIIYDESSGACEDS